MECLSRPWRWFRWWLWGGGRGRGGGWIDRTVYGMRSITKVTTKSRRWGRALRYDMGLWNGSVVVWCYQDTMFSGLFRDSSKCGCSVQIHVCHV